MSTTITIAVHAADLKVDRVRRNYGIELFTPDGAIVGLIGTHEEIRTLAYRIIEAADATKADEWASRVGDDVSPDDYGDTTLEEANAYLQSVGIDLDKLDRPL